REDQVSQVCRSRVVLTWGKLEFAVLVLGADTLLEIGEFGGVVRILGGEIALLLGLHPVQVLRVAEVEERAVTHLGAVQDTMDDLQLRDRKMQVLPEPRLRLEQAVR